MKTIEKDFKGTAGEFRSYHTGTARLNVVTGEGIHLDNIASINGDGTIEEVQANARLFAGAKRMAERLEKCWLVLRAVHAGIESLPLPSMSNGIQEEMEQIETLMEEIL